MKRFFIENKNLVFLWVLCGIALLIFSGHYSNILLDIGREVYYPEQILSGKVLYKDLFNIYGPFSYLWNALLYKIFSPNLGTLYFSGALCSFAIVSGIYLLARKFLSEFLSVSLGIYTIVCGVCATHLFNYTLPYSFAMLYGTVGFIYSLLTLVKYKEQNKTQYLYLAALLGGFCVANKYDFFLYGLFLFIIAILTKNKKIVLNFITCFMFVPLLCGLVLFLQGLGIVDCIKAYNDIKSIVSSECLKIFYTHIGIFYSPKVLSQWLINFIKTSFGFVLIAGGIKLFDKSKTLGILVTGVGVLAFYMLIDPGVIIFMGPLILLTALFNYKAFRHNHTIVCLLIATLTVIPKHFWIFLNFTYGNYIASVVVCVFLIMLFARLDDKYQKAFAIGLLVISLYYLVQYSISLSGASYKISTNKGTIYTDVEDADLTNDVISMLSNGAQKVLVYPEGLLINFLANVESDGYYNSMLPLYTEALGEEKFIEVLEKFEPDYVILSNLNMREYGVNYICDNYASNFCSTLIKNYEIAGNMGLEFKYLIWVKK